VSGRDAGPVSLVVRTITQRESAMPRAARRTEPTRKEMYHDVASDIHDTVPASARMLERYMPGVRTAR
jgi:hypothetical protein